MRCENCKSITVVVDSRSQRSTIRRRRKCSACGFRFTTYEVSDSIFATLKNLARAQKALHDASIIAATVVDTLNELEEDRGPHR